MEIISRLYCNISTTHILLMYSLNYTYLHMVPILALIYILYSQYFYTKIYADYDEKLIRSFTIYIYVQYLWSSYVFVCMFLFHFECMNTAHQRIANSRNIQSENKKKMSTITDDDDGLNCYCWVYIL